MINIHLNGDCVRQPDMKEIQRRLSELHDKKHKCKYGFTQVKCEAWRKYQTSGRCMLMYNELCPCNKQRIDQGNLKKSFRIDNVNYRKLSSSAHYLVKKSKYKTLFLTLTFPKFKTEYNEKQINECFSKFVENLRSHYNCSGYVAVRERGERFNRVHFHILCSVPYIPFNVLNNAWCSSISDICESSKSAIRTEKKTLFIHNPGRALRYVCKYFAKGRGQSSETRLIFMSNNLIRKPERFDNSISEFYQFTDLIEKYKSVQIRQTSDYTTLFRITDPNEFDDFCKVYLYKLFHLSEKNTDFYSYPLTKN